MKTEDENTVETFLDYCCPHPQPSAVICWFCSLLVFLLRLNEFQKVRCADVECPADANWADISAVFTSLRKNHIIIGLRGGGFKARLRTKNNWKLAALQSTAEVPLSKVTNPQVLRLHVWGSLLTLSPLPRYMCTCVHLYVQSFVWF